jgi:hypothetical protein
MAACSPGAASTDSTLGQTVLDLGDAVNALRQESALLQEQVDSLRTQVARQDTLIRRLTAVVPVPSQ